MNKQEQANRLGKIDKQGKVYLYINWNSMQSIKEAEAYKEQLENEGYSLIDQNGSLDKTTLIYSKQ